MANVFVEIQYTKMPVWNHDVSGTIPTATALMNVPTQWWVRWDGSGAVVIVGRWGGGAVARVGRVRVRVRVRACVRACVRVPQLVC